MAHRVAHVRGRVEAVGRYYEIELPRREALEALLATARRPVTTTESYATGYGWASGNLIGLGLGNTLVDQCCSTEFEDRRADRILSRSTLTGGTIGGVAGFAAGPNIELTMGDQGLIALGTIVSTANSAALGFVASEKTGFDNTDGITLITAGVALPTTLAISQFTEPELDQVLLSTSAVGWGMWYGALTPIALRMDGDEADLALVTTISADLMLAGSLFAMSSSVELDPKRTVIPQLGAVTGATLGALGVALYDDDESIITAGALGGSLIGLAGGVALEVKNQPQLQWMERSTTGQGSRIELPGIWIPAVSPTVMENGEPGVMLALSVTDW